MEAMRLAILRAKSKTDRAGETRQSGEFCFNLRPPPRGVGKARTSREIKARNPQGSALAAIWLIVLPTAPSHGSARTHQSSEHAEHDCSEEGKGYDGREYVEPCAQFHQRLLAGPSRRL